MRKLVRRQKAAAPRRSSTGSHSRRSTSTSSRTRQDRSSQISCYRKADRFGLGRQASKHSIGRTSRSSTHTSSVYPDALLLRLPSEIRICILRHLVPSSDRDIVFYTDSELNDNKCRKRKDQHARQPLAILRTNRIIYQEAISILYSENAFHFIGSNYLPILDFVRRLSPNAKPLVRKLRITWLTGERGPRDSQFNLFCMAMLDSLPGLISFDTGTWIWF